MERILSYKSGLESYIQGYLAQKQGRIYEPLSYILGLGGKRLRPCLLIAMAEAFGVDAERALSSAAAIEFFHNFTLLHDDIMDDAPKRRGHDTVHVKWDRDQAILSGDIMYTLSLELMCQGSHSRHMQMLQSFNRTAEQVCVGQQWDMDFEEMDEVSPSAYLDMIEGKTSVLIGAAMEIGALMSEAPDDQVKSAYDFGLNMGLAFQMQDDILDAFGTAEQVGKQEGGDILQNKKTLLFIRCLDALVGIQKDELLTWYAHKGGGMEKVNAVRELMRSSGALSAVQSEQQTYIGAAEQHLEALDISVEWKKEFHSILAHQLKRVS